MKWKTRNNLNWHKVFAWLPKSLKGEHTSVWLCFVERKLDTTYDDAVLWGWIYREVKK